MNYLYEHVRFLNQSSLISMYYVKKYLIYLYRVQFFIKLYFWSKLYWGMFDKHDISMIKCKNTDC